MFNCCCCWFSYSVDGFCVPISAQVPYGGGGIPPILSDRDDFGIFFGSLIEVGINLGKVIFAKICLLWGREGAKNTSFHCRSLFIVISFCFDLFFFAARISFLPCAFVSTATSHCSPSPVSLLKRPNLQ